MKPKIRFIVETISSECDRNGNTYHFARITSTVTGNSMLIKDIGGPSNARGLVARAVDRLAPCIYNIEKTSPKRQWKAWCKNDDCWPSEHEVTPSMIIYLEQ